jgi:hypothetical protein
MTPNYSQGEKFMLEQQVLLLAFNIINLLLNAEM